MATMDGVIEMPVRYPAAPLATYPYKWRTRKQEAARYGEPCKIIGRIGMAIDGGVAVYSYGWGFAASATVVVEFVDGIQVTTTRGSVRRRNRP